MKTPTRSAAALVAVVGLALLGTTATAHAAPDPLGASRAEDHAMGSQIREHEGGDRGVVIPTDPNAQAVVYGIDVSGHQGNVDWNHWWNQGKRFAYVKATESTGYRNPYFAQQYNGSYNVGMIRGAYHFALPDRSDGAAQADFFASNGGGWSRDGKTLPGAVDLEYNPYGDTCYGLSQADMGAWVRAFSDRMVERTGRYPTIYTSTSWWNRCVGEADRFGGTSPLWVAHYADALGALPHGWDYQTIWQWQAAGLFPGDQNLFNGNDEQLLSVALG